MSNDREMSLEAVKWFLRHGDRDTLETLLDQYSGEVLEAAYECDIEPDRVEECYVGEFDSDSAFAFDMAEQIGEIPNDNHWPHYCIDWQYAARELMYDYCSSNGHYFRIY